MKTDMRALTVIPQQAGSLALVERAAPAADSRRALARTLSIGICGTDHEIASGRYGTAPEGDARLVIGHESLAEIVSAPPGSGLAPGDLIVGIVRRPDPVPCASCAAGEWDMCRNGLYTERGIKGLHGYAQEYFAIDPAFAVRLDPALRRTGVLLEPASIVAKAWDQIARIGARASWHPRTVLVTGAGPIGLLAALMARQRGLEVHLFDRNEGGVKPALAAQLGAAYHTGDLAALDLRPDIVVECTGAPAVIVAAMEKGGAGGIVCLAGLSGGKREIVLDAALLSRTMVLENDVVFGTVNANRRHYALAAEALATADPAWLGALITRRVALADWRAAFAPDPDGVKTVIDFTSP
jgi:threonine dehydrogenase-like Zn-dependent dehydrogenase